MTAPTRRQLMAGSLAAVGAAGAPAITVAADPEERLRNAVQELQDAMQARWSDRWVQVYDMRDTQTPSFMVAAWSNPPDSQS